MPRGIVDVESSLGGLVSQSNSKQDTSQKAENQFYPSKTAQICLLKLVDSFLFHPPHLPLLELPAISTLASAGCISPSPPHLPVQCSYYAVNLKPGLAAPVLLLAP